MTFKSRVAAATFLFSVGFSALGQTASTEPIRFGWMVSLTGPLSAPGQGVNVGVKLAVDEINASGGINGRRVELLTRDTATDPTKAVSLATQLIHSDKVHVILGPLASGESLATVPIVARTGIPNIVTASVDELTDPKKYPRAFRIHNTVTQWVTFGNDYVVNKSKRTKIALISDTTGYGSVSSRIATEDLRKKGVVPVYTVLIEPNKTDLTDEVSKARAAGADVIMTWSAATGLLARLLNARGDANWDVPVVGHPSLMALPLKQLLNKPSYWDNVYGVGYVAASFDGNGKLPERSQALLNKARPVLGGGEIDTLFSWIAMGYDAVKVAEYGIRKAGSTDPQAVTKALETSTDIKAVLGVTLQYAPDKRDGFGDEHLAINIANTFKDGNFRIAPKELPKR